MIQPSPEQSKVPEFSGSEGGGNCGARCGPGDWKLMRAQTLLTAYAVLAVLGGVRGAAIIEDHTESYAVRVAACVPPACRRLTPGRWAGGKALGLAGRGVRHCATGRALPESAGRVHRVRKL